MNILITSVGRRAYLVSYFKDALKGFGQVHASNCEETYAFKIADKSVVTPLIYEDNYIDFLISYCRENNINAIISLFDIDLPVLAKNKTRFEEIGIKVIVSDYKTTQICNDKWNTYNFLKSNGFQTTNNYINLNKCMDEISNNVISFPVVVKPRWGMGSNGMFMADTMKELEVLYEKSKNYILNSYLKYESEPYKEECVIMQERYNGYEYGVDILNSLEGEYIKSVPMKVCSMRAGESEKVEIVNDNELDKIAKLISKKIKIIGVWNIDAIKYNNRYYILDINCRFNGLSPFSYIAGVNYPKAIVNMLQNKPLGDELMYNKVGAIGYKAINPVRFD